MTSRFRNIFSKKDPSRWEIPVSYKSGMQVPGLIYASEDMLSKIVDDNAFEQVANVAFLPGIVGHSMAMPDIHWGYGFPIGGVAATRVEDGVVSPGGVGFDINCGVRLLRTCLTESEIRPKIRQLVDELYYGVPSGVGSSGALKISEKELDKVLVNGSRWAVENGYGASDDICYTEEQGCIKGANPDKVSRKAKQRGMPQLGTLGSGNHFLEISVIDEIYSQDAAEIMGLGEPGQVVIMIHTGSRGFGHQVCTDYVSLMVKAVQRYGINLPDRQLACTPVNSDEGKAYLTAMACAANYAWANRQIITHWTRDILSRVFNKTSRDIGLEQVYDVAHNIAKIETHLVHGKKQKLCVHRKGATRAFPPGHSEIPDRYRTVGQPVLIPGDMGRYSFVAAGTDTAMQETFGSTCHGAGRMKSRAAAKKDRKGADVIRMLEERGITVRAGSMSSVAEEAPDAYKDVMDVVGVADQAGISKKVVKLKPVGVIKG